MNGYLQRLVQTAAQPAQAVHPLAGSVFAPNHENQSSGPESEESVVADRPKTPSDAISQHQDMPEQDPRRDDTPPRPYRHMAPIRSATPFPPEDASDVSQSRREQFVQSPRPAVPVEENTEQPPKPLFHQTEFHPLMPREAIPVEPQVAHPPFQPETRPARDSRVPAGLARESDDIQIHIGRIEVTAVPPAPRTAKTPDRGLSLDSYLNRRAR
jgi:hypothetical protein